MRAFWHTQQGRSRFTFIQKAEDTYRSFSASGRALFIFFASLLVVSAVGLVFLLNQSLLVNVPAHGGSLAEGIVGAPRFINPVLAISDADRDLSALVYSGLLKATPEGSYVPDIAESYDISSDGRTYTFHLRHDTTFHDGTPITADDVIFTIQKTQDAALKSPVRANWDGVVVSSSDPYTVTFVLKGPYAPFIENATLGILPKNLWQNISDDEFPFSELNVSPVGSGPFRVTSIERTSSGVPSSYKLVAFNGYALGKPYMDDITFRFYQNESDLISALKSGAVEAASGISPAALSALSAFRVEHSSLNRVFGVFFNQNQSVVLRETAVRRALNDAIDRDDLVQKILGGFGTPLDGPVPPSILGRQAESTTTDIDMAIAKAQDELIKAGWKLGPDGIMIKTTGSGKTAKTERLEFTLATGNVPELRAAADYVKTIWGRVGADVTIQIYDQGDLSQNIIRPRKYDALLFGEVVGRELDLFAFWHSSQRNDPGLNIAGYANSTADTLLEQLRQTSDQGKRATLYTQFNTELKKDIPAVFLYAPDFVYIVPNDLRGVTLGLVETPSDRFLSAQLWHKETDQVWPLFAR
ncbi:MAG TPA: peptide ABC transporter substrate-binding protein [Candidatus Paceibacterota bacterium]|nr:peptide ABC transporter substrate-binding protein [Candidatus Paceibacterota bacterium]